MRRRSNEAAPPHDPAPQRLTIRAIVLAGLMAAAGAPLAGCGKDIKLKSYDPAPEPSAAKWRTWVIGDPAKLAVPPPPSANSAKAKQETEELERVADKRSLAEEREARFWGLEPTVRPWIATGLNQWTHRNKHDPVAAARSYALLSVAMYDATVATWYWKYRYKRKRPPGEPLSPPGKEPSYPSEHAAIAGAAERVLSYVFAEKRPAEFNGLAQEAAKSRIVAGTNYRSDVEAGLELGRRVGDAVVSRAKADGSARAWSGQRPRGRGFWEPPPGSKAAPVQPVAGSWRPWVLSSGRQFRPPGPPRFDSPEMRSQTQRVVESGRKLSPGRQGTATRWEGGPGTPQLPGTWNQVALTRVDRRNLSIPRTARMFALLNVSMADAGIAAWDAKYTYWSPRPQNAARDLGVARNWKPFLPTPASPSYVSDHSAFSAAAAQILSYVFPDTAGRFRSEAARASRSAIYGGIQFPFGDEAGRRIGDRVGEQVIGRARGDGSGR